MYDNAEHLNISYPPGLTPEEQLEYVTDTAKVFLLMCISIHMVEEIRRFNVSCFIFNACES